MLIELTSIDLHTQNTDPVFVSLQHIVSLWAVTINLEGSVDPVTGNAEAPPIQLCTVTALTVVTGDQIFVTEPLDDVVRILCPIGVQRVVREPLA